MLARVKRSLVLAAILGATAPAAAQAPQPVPPGQPSPEP
jgi:hypothetical protein